MRTTLNLDPDIVAVARKLASAREQSLGEVISELARNGLARPPRRATRRSSGFPVFTVSADAHPITSEDVRLDEDEA